MYRTSAKDLLKNKVFDKIRNLKLEVGSKVMVEIEEDDDYEIEQVDEEPDNLKIEDPSNNVFADANKKFKFPPISGDKLSVCLI